ncbi:MAG TPA: TOBE domain-containing protein [Opitutaceae bacterium]|nr:TOBE domain-containing protein [Opitutaceae bacterium]
MTLPGAEGCLRVPNEARRHANDFDQNQAVDQAVWGDNGARATVETAIGRFEGVLSDAAAKPAAGAAVTVSIRPECWKLGLELAGAPNSVRGKIGEAVYLGEVAQYDFAAGGVRLKIVEMNPRFAGVSASGELTASVDPEDVVVLAE